MGSTLGYMTWKSFKSVDVQIFIASDTLRDFLALSTTTTTSFMNTFQKSIPDLDTDEFKFIMAIGGTITNISAQKSGREYFLEEMIGLKLLDNIIKIVGDIPMPKGQLLKR